ncbi:MAG: hypothetical protein KC468_30160, partial [Myxococcales bacterium]|nr:hypothetical protein [Myxococcales bacterium]
MMRSSRLMVLSCGFLLALASQAGCGDDEMNTGSGTDSDTDDESGTGGESSDGTSAGPGTDPSGTDSDSNSGDGDGDGERDGDGDEAPPGHRRARLRFGGDDPFEPREERLVIGRNRAALVAARGEDRERERER